MPTHLAKDWAKFVTDLQVQTLFIPGFAQVPLLCKSKQFYRGTNPSFVCIIICHCTTPYKNMDPYSCRVVQWLAQSPHSKKVLDYIPAHCSSCLVLFSRIKIFFSFMYNNYSSNLPKTLNRLCEWMVCVLSCVLSWTGSSPGSRPQWDHFLHACVVYLQCVFHIVATACYFRQRTESQLLL